MSCLVFFFLIPASGIMQCLPKSSGYSNGQRENQAVGQGRWGWAVLLLRGICFCKQGTAFGGQPVPFQKALWLSSGQFREGTWSRECHRVAVSSPAVVALGTENGFRTRPGGGEPGRGSCTPPAAPGRLASKCSGQRCYSHLWWAQAWPPGTASEGHPQLSVASRVPL